MSRKRYVLVPGAWHGSWCWQRLARRLEEEGHETIVMDLEGCASVGASPAKVTLETWVASVCTVIGSRGEPVTLVGHSRGGIVVSQVAERLPERIEALVYVAGLLVPNRESALAMLREDGTSPLLREVALSADGEEWLLSPDAARAMFYGECTPADAQAALSSLGREPAKPMMTPLRLSDERFGRVPRRYIECVRDAAVPLALQRRMQLRLPCHRVASIDSDHAPFLSAPHALAERLLEG